MRNAVSTQVNPGRNFQKNCFKNKAFTENADLSEILKNALACSKRSDSGERCEVKKAMKSRGGLGREVREQILQAFPLSPLPLPRINFFALLFTSHRSSLSERLEQAKNAPSYAYRSVVKENRENNQLFDVLLIITVLNYCFDFRS